MIDLDLHCHVWLAVVLLDSTDPRLIDPLCLFPSDSITVWKVSLRESCLETAMLGSTVEDFVSPGLGQSIKGDKES